LGALSTVKLSAAVAAAKLKISIMAITAEQERKLDKFVQNEVHAQVNRLVEFSLEKDAQGFYDAPVTLDDFENLYRYPEFHGTHLRFEGGTEEDRNEEIEKLEDWAEQCDQSEMNGHDPVIDSEIDELKELEAEPQEIFEYWLVSLHLANDLERKGEPIAKVGGVGYVWGRTCTGQAISMDSVIQDIYSELNS
jgi:hypothetical protein